MAYHEIAFDTDLFGFNVGRIEDAGPHANDIRTVDSLKAKLAEAAADGIKLLYWTLDTKSTASEALLKYIQSSNIFTSGKVIYRVELNQSVVQILKSHRKGIDLSISSFDGLEPTKDLLDLAVVCGTPSRFGTDCNLPTEFFHSLYKKWMANCVNNTVADVVLVARVKSRSFSDHSIVGMAALRIKDAVAQICLLAVDPSHHRRGIGAAILIAAYERALQQGVDVLTVATQTSNLPACALYERCGGVAIDHSYDIHFWLGNVPVNDPVNSMIPFNQTYLTNDSSLTNLQKLFESGCINTHYHFGPLCERKLESSHPGTIKALLCGSGTGALELCSLCIGSTAGVEVIMPSYTFVSTASAFVTHGATPVFVDVRADTQNIDETKIEAAITSRTRAICCVHYAGVPCEMDAIMAIAKKHNLYVIEDNAHGVFSSYKGRVLGTIGDMAALSFHYTKNIVCGEGGAVLINNSNMIRTACIAWEKGTNRMDFLEGKTDKYAESHASHTSAPKWHAACSKPASQTFSVSRSRLCRYFWVSKGGSFVMSEILAAVVDAQLDKWPTINMSRMRTWNMYHAGLEVLERNGKLRRPVVPEGCVHNAHIYYVRISDPDAYARVKKRAAERKIGLMAHYLPLHLSPAAKMYAIATDCPESVASSSSILRLPVWVGLTDTQIAEVLAVFHDSLADISAAPMQPTD